MKQEQTWEKGLETTQKLITFCVPAYNSAPFLHFAIDSLLPFGKQIEVIIIDDGSKDDTGKVADSFAADHPDFIRVIHQKNGGHGAGINRGILEAKGLYFKVLDSDDWVDQKALGILLSEISFETEPIDLYITDYQYWRGRDKKGQYISYRYLFKKGCSEGGWDDLKTFKYSSNLTLHSTMYRTEILRLSGVKCPEHVSYEDNYFVYCPMPYVEKIRYVEVPLYQYLVGREGQSMENDTCIRKYHDFILDGTLIFDSHDIMAYKKDYPGLYRAMRHHLLLNMVMVPTFARLKNTKESNAELKEFWLHCKKGNYKQYRSLRKHVAIFTLMFPGQIGITNVKSCYKLSHLLVRYN